MKFTIHIFNKTDPALLCLQDYLVLLPSAYYEAPILQIRVTEACTYSSVADASQRYVCTNICHLNQVISYCWGIITD